MCTLSWAPEGEGYRIWMNRDELRGRMPAKPPFVQRLGLVRFVAPVDGQAGGTWIATSERGLTLCLLNRREQRPSDAAVISRGYLVATLIDCLSRTELAWRCAAAGLERFLPFTLAAFEPDRPVLLLTWDGDRLTTGTTDRPGLVAASSSVEPDAVNRVRRDLFEQHLAGGAASEPERYEELHRSHEPAPGPLSVCMHRPDAATVSLTSVHLTATEVQMTYIAGAPCEGAAPLITRLPREIPLPAAMRRPSTWRIPAGL